VNAYVNNVVSRPALVNRVSGADKVSLLWKLSWAAPERGGRGQLSPCALVPPAVPISNLKIVECP